MSVIYKLDGPKGTFAEFRKPFEMPKDEPSVRTPHGDFLMTKAYLTGAWRAQEGKPSMNPYPPGPDLAQYNYGYANELHGYHDEVDLPFERINNG